VKPTRVTASLPAFMMVFPGDVVWSMWLAISANELTPATRFWPCRVRATGVSQWRVTQRAAISRAETESSTTGTKFDIAATDQIRPIATTPAIIHASMRIPSTSLSLSIGGSLLARCEVVHRCAKLFGSKAEERTCNRDPASQGDSPAGSRHLRITNRVRPSSFPRGVGTILHPTRRLVGPISDSALPSRCLWRARWRIE